MRRLRRRFALVALLVAVPVTLLVWRAVASVAVERATRHEIVAERLFDEMERALSDLLAREEARPFAAYTSEGLLAAPPADAAPVVAFFQVEPDGAVRTAATARPLLEGFWRAPGALADVSAPAATANAPATDAREASKAKGDAYDAFRSLNKAVEQRFARQRKMADEYAADDSGVSASAPARGADAEKGRLDAGDRRRPPDLPPMVGQLADAGHLLLYRTVVRDGRGYRQGALLDVARLADWLRTQVLDGGELAEQARVAIGSTLAPPAVDASADDFRYRHRFAEPFAGVAAALALRPLPGVGDATYVYALSALLLVAMLGGLVALYRMVAVAIGFAERRSDFVAAVSHELKTPLTAIRMYGEMLRDGIVASEAKRDEYHRHITAEAERLSRLIANVLEFAKLERGTRAMQLVSGPIAPLIAETASLLAPHVQRAGLALRLDVDPTLPAARFERDALLQVLFNVVDNAVKYAAGAATPEIVLRARQVGDRVVVSVRDHGPGVPVAHLGRIFEPFYRGERELTRRSAGTGLGLALVRGLVDGMGATVEGHNADGGGFELAIGLAVAS